MLLNIYYEKEIEMRNKLKKIWNKEDGFTLVELLGVIVILGIILAIAVPALGNIISKARDNTANAEQELVIDAAQLYFVDQEATVNSVTVQVLEDNGFLQIKADSKIDRNDSVEKIDGKYVFKDN